MGIGYDIGRAIGTIGKQRGKQDASKMSKKEIDEYLRIKARKNKMAAMEKRYNEYIAEETKKAYEGCTIWNYLFKTGKFKDW